MLDEMIGKQWKLALFITRLTVGFIFLMHGLQKVIGINADGGISHTIQSFTDMGFSYPVLVAWTVSVIESIGGMLILLGLFMREAAFVLMLSTGASLLFVRLSNGFFVSNGGYEFSLVLFAMNLCLFLGGSGLFSLDNVRNRRSKWIFANQSTRLKLNK